EVGCPEVLYRGRGCRRCRNTGFAGRIALFELLRISSDIREMILSEHSTDRIEKHALDTGLITLRQSGLRKVAQGVTTVEEQLAAMLEAGIHLVRILSALARESDDRRFAKMIESVRDSLSAGMTFADALGRFPRVFSRLYVAVVRAGEASGALHVVLNNLTVNLERAAHLRRKVKGAVAYPIVILVVALGIVFAMVVKIVPIFEEVYKKANATLPAP